MEKSGLKPLSTYPELREKLKELSREILDFGSDSERGQRAAEELANNVFEILRDEDLAIADPSLLEPFEAKGTGPISGLAMFGMPPAGSGKSATIRKDQP